jgi:hypothetical protein
MTEQNKCTDREAFARCVEELQFHERLMESSARATHDAEQRERLEHVAACFRRGWEALAKMVEAK